MLKTIFAIFMIAILIILSALSDLQAAAPTDTERITALEAQMKDLQEQQKQLAEQNRRLLELMQKMAGGKTEATTATANKQASTSTSSQRVAAREAKAEAAPVEPKTTYGPGWLARIISVPKNFNITDTLPPLEVLNFPAKKSSYYQFEYFDLIEGAFHVQYPLWKAEGYLNAQEAGNYVFSISSSGQGVSGKVAKAIYAEGNSLASGLDDTLTGAIEISEPGMYRIEFRVRFDGSQYFSNLDNHGYPPSFTFNLQVKRPSDEQLRPISEVLLVEKTILASNTGKK